MLALRRLALKQPLAAARLISTSSVRQSVKAGEYKLVEAEWAKHEAAQKKGHHDHHDDHHHHAHYVSFPVFFLFSEKTTTKQNEKERDCLRKGR